jgi:hypothetical protein
LIVFGRVFERESLAAQQPTPALVHAVQSHHTKLVAYHLAGCSVIYAWLVWAELHSSGPAAGVVGLLVAFSFLYIVFCVVTLFSIRKAANRSIRDLPRYEDKPSSWAAFWQLHKELYPPRWS